MNLIQLIYGSNVMRIDEKAASISKKYVGEPDDFNLITLNYKETPVEALIEEAQTLPFLSDKKALIINDVFSFTGARVKSDVNHDIDLLLEYISNKNDDTLIIFKVFNEQLDKRKKLTKLIQKNGQVTEISEMTEHELLEYIKKNLQEENINMSDETAQLFLHRTGMNYTAVTNELRKLMLYVDDNVTNQDVEEIVSISLEQNIFKLTEYILNGRKTDAVQLVRELILQKEEPMQLLHLIISQFRLLYQVKLLMGEGFQQDYIARELKVHPYRVKLAQREVRRYQQNVLEEKMVKCRDMDYRFKSSYLERETLFELFLLEI